MSTSLKPGKKVGTALIWCFARQSVLKRAEKNLKTETIINAMLYELQLIALLYGGVRIFYKLHFHFLLV
jgi:hypothetical protein